MLTNEDILEMLKSIAIVDDSEPLYEGGNRHLRFFCRCCGQVHHDPDLIEHVNFCDYEIAVQKVRSDNVRS